MTIEDMLVDLGDSRLSTNRYWSVLLGMVNTHLPAGSKLSKDHTGNDVIGAIYGLGDEVIRNAILTRPCKNAVRSDNFRVTLLTLGSFFTVIVCSLALMAIFSENGNSEAYELLKMVIQEAIRLSALFNPTPPATN